MEILFSYVNFIYNHKLAECGIVFISTLPLHSPVLPFYKNRKYERCPKMNLYFARLEGLYAAIACFMISSLVFNFQQCFNLIYNTVQIKFS